MCMKPEMDKICVKCSGLKAVEVMGMVSQPISTQEAAFVIHFAELK